MVTRDNVTTQITPATIHEPKKARVKKVAVKMHAIRVDLPTEIYRPLQAMASENDRSVAATVRRLVAVAVREYKGTK